MTRTIDNGNSAAATRSPLQGKCGVGKNLICMPVCEQPGELGSDTPRKNLSIPPTIKVPVGYRFNVRVNRDILFDAPYTPAQE
jgi:type IV secretory pathway VirB10-like protein